MNNKRINDKIIQYPILNDAISALALKNLSERTVTNYLDGIARFLDFIQYDNSFDITIEHFRQYLIHLNSLPLKKNSVNNYNSHIRFFFNAVLYKSVNPYIVPMAKADVKEIDFLTDSQIRSLLSATYVDSRFDCIVKLALCCGLRINEVISLKVCDIHTRDSSKYIFVRESKRNKSRFVPMDNTVYRAIQRYAKEYHILPGSECHFFRFSTYSCHTCNETIRRYFNIYKSAAGLQESLTFHSLRHTFAVNFLKAGGDVIDLKYRLGHGSLMSTSRYLHFTRNMMNTDISYLDTLLKGVL